MQETHVSSNLSATGTRIIVNNDNNDYDTNESGDISVEMTETQLFESYFVFSDEKTVFQKIVNTGVKCKVIYS